MDIVVSGFMVAVSVFLLVGLGTVSWYTNQKSTTRTPASFWFAMVAYGLALWSLTSLMTDIDLSRTVLWSRMSFFGMFGALYGLVRFVDCYPVDIVRNRIFNVTSWILFIIFSLVSVSPFVVKDMRMIHGVTNVVSGPLYELYLTSLTCIIVYAIFKLWVSWKNALDIRVKKQLTYILSGVAVLASTGVIFNILFPVFLGLSQYYWISSLSCVVFVGCIGYALAKYQLFDVRLAFVRTVSYALTLAALSLLLFLVVSLGLLEVIGLSDLTLRQEIVLFLVVSIIGFLTPVMLQFFNSLTHRLFYRGEYSPEAALSLLNNVINAGTSVDELSRQIAAALRDALNLEGVSIVIAENQSSPKKYASGKAPTMPLATIDGILDGTTIRVAGMMMRPEESAQLENRRIGGICKFVVNDTTRVYTLIGEKKNGHTFTASEVSILNVYTNELRIAFQNLLHFDEIKAFNKRLKAEINHATRELRDSNTRLKALDATKDEFVSMASHQLRTPLTSVKGYISMVLEGDAGSITDAQRQLLEEAFSSSERMVKLIADFLNVSRLQTGKFIIDPSLLDLSKLVQEEVDGMKQIAHSHSMVIHYRSSKRIPLLYLDEDKIRQVVMNFIDNAIYYSPESTTINVTLEIEDGDIVLRVRDHGMGVSKAEQKQLFEKFFRADNARRQRPDGTGIGLYLAKKVVTGHGGSILFSSNMGKGSTFGFRLPIRRLTTPPSPVGDSQSQK